MDDRATLELQVLKSGFAFLPTVGRGLSTPELVERLGLSVAPFSTDDKLTVSTKRHGNTYSGVYGTAEFPLHTDCAHWLDPPRLLLLSCVSGDASVATLVADGRELMGQLSAQALSKALVRQRRPIEGKRNLMALLEYPQGELARLRWDSVFIEPATLSCSQFFPRVSAAVRSLSTVEIVLRSPGDVLIIDNWRMLHGRSTAADASNQRLISRTFLKGFE